MDLVIIESPYAGNIALNTAYARACVRDSLERGEAPIASHLLYPQPGILREDVSKERAWGIAAGLEWRKVAQQVFYTDLGWSPGMQAAKHASTTATIRNIGGLWFDPIGNRDTLLARFGFGPGIGTPIGPLEPLLKGQGLPVPPPLRVKRLDPRAILPIAATALSSGFDLYALNDTTLTSTVQLVHTGIAIEGSPLWDVQVRTRSSLARIGVRVAPGTVDADYRGELLVMMHVMRDDQVHIKGGSRIAQLVINPVVRPEVVEVDELSETLRGTGGFGSTGA